VNSLELARWQFGLTTLIHFAFVATSIGLVFWVAALQTRWHRTGEDRYLRLTRFYGKLLLLSFAVGVVTGLMQTFQFGMNWSRFSRYVGDIFGAPLALEGLAAFFVEAIFLGLWMFGWGRLPRRLHLASIWIVAVATCISAFAILAVNSWMQHPVGYEIVDGRAQLVDVWAVLFNATVGLTLGHALSAALLTGTVVVLAVASWHLLRGREVAVFGPLAGVAVKVGLVAGIAALVFGHFQGVLAVEQQPMKMAAAEALYRTESGAGLSVLAVGELATNPGEPWLNIKIPSLLSLVNDLSTSSTFRGINELEAEAILKHGPGDYVPVVGLMYWSFRAMIGAGMALILLMAVGCWLAARGRLTRSRRFLNVAVWAAVLPQLGQVGGWILREGGRQPWVVEGLLRTDMADSPNVGAWTVALSLVAFLAIYGAVAWLAGRVAAHEIREGLEDEAPATAPPDGAPARGPRSTGDLALTY